MQWLIDVETGTVRDAAGKEIPLEHVPGEIKDVLAARMVDHEMAKIRKAREAEEAAAAAKAEADAKAGKEQAP